MPDEEPARDAGPGTPRRPPGALEAEVMDVLRAAGAPLSPGQVRERLTARQLEELSYSTVVIHCDKAKAVFGAATLT